MAQQIQFLYLTQEEYDNLAVKQDSRLYFTSDTHRIYKGANLYATGENLDEVHFNTIEASSIQIDGKDVSLEGHTHLVSDITDWDSAALGVVSLDAQTIDADAITVNGSDVSLEGHIHTMSDISDFAVPSHSHSVYDITDWATTDVNFSAINATDIMVNGSAVSLEGHTHYASEITDLVIPSQMANITITEVSMHEEE